MLLYVESFSLQCEQNIKSQIMLAENLGNKLITASMVVKKPKNINMIKEIYSDLFKEELTKQDLYTRKASEGEDLINLMLDLSDELKGVNK